MRALSAPCELGSVSAGTMPLAVALMRATGIKAHVVTGKAGSGYDVTGHAWMEFHNDERWVEMDPTFASGVVNVVDPSGRGGILLPVSHCGNRELPVNARINELVNARIFVSTAGKSCAPHCWHHRTIHAQRP